MRRSSLIGRVSVDREGEELSYPSKAPKSLMCEGSHERCDIGENAPRV